MLVDITRVVKQQLVALGSSDIGCTTFGGDLHAYHHQCVRVFITDLLSFASVLLSTVIGLN